MKKFVKVVWKNRPRNERYTLALTAESYTEELSRKHRELMEIIQQKINKDQVIPHIGRAKTRQSKLMRGTPPTKKLLFA